MGCKDEGGRDTEMQRIEKTKRERSGTHTHTKHTKAMSENSLFVHIERVRPPAEKNSNCNLIASLRVLANEHRARRAFAHAHMNIAHAAHLPTRIAQRKAPDDTQTKPELNPTAPELNPN